MSTKNPSPYRLEKESGGCKTCKSGALWCIVGPDGFAIATFYEDKEEAEEMCDALNQAYQHGFNRTTRPHCDHRWVRGKDKLTRCRRCGTTEGAP